MGGLTSQVTWRQPWGGASKALLVASLRHLGASVEDLPSQQWDPKTSTIGGIRDYQLSVIGPAGPTWSSILLHLNSALGEPLARQLSKSQDGPVFLFLEFNEATWGYTLFSRGSQTDHFWSAPEIVGESPGMCEGNARAVAEACGSEEDAVSPYLRPARFARLGEKAYPEDEYPLDNHWVRIDFMRRLGIHYPDPGKHLHVLVDESHVRPHPRDDAPSGTT